MQNDFQLLPIRFEKSGFLFWQICRTNTAAIYEQRTKDGTFIFYEVWRVRTRPAFQIQGESYPAGERAPGNQDWGRFGWTYYNLPDARKKYDELNGRIVTPLVLNRPETEPGTLINAKF